MKLSGMVAILSENTVVGIRDLGPEPVEVKPGLVLPLLEQKPELSSGEQYVGPDYLIGVDSVTAVWTKESIPEEPPSLEDRIAALEDALVEKSVLTQEELSVKVRSNLKTKG